MADELESNYVESDTQALAQAIRSRAVTEVLYPVGPRMDKLRNYVARLHGPFPDAYDMIALGVHTQQLEVLSERAREADSSIPKAHSFNWSDVEKEPIIQLLKETSVSMGGGKGRREGVELGRATGNPEQRSRWSWRRRRD